MATCVPGLRNLLRPSKLRQSTSTRAANMQQETELASSASARQQWGSGRAILTMREQSEQRLTCVVKSPSCHARLSAIEVASAAGILTIAGRPRHGQPWTYIPYSGRSCVWGEGRRCGAQASCRGPRGRRPSMIPACKSISRSWIWSCDRSCHSACQPASGSATGRRVD